MEQRFITLSRNYSRKEGGEMFSLTMSREIEKESTHNRQRIESYLLFYDVEIQILEEIFAFEYVTRDFLVGRQKAIANTVGALLNRVYTEMESGTLTAFQIGLNEETIDRAYERLVNFLPERREVTAVAKVEEVEREVAIEVVLNKSVDRVETVEVEDEGNDEVTITFDEAKAEAVATAVVEPEQVVAEKAEPEKVSSIEDLGDAFLL